MQPDWNDISDAQFRATFRAWVEENCPADLRYMRKQRPLFDEVAVWYHALAAKGWLAPTWPKQYGGHERSHLERYVVIEEMLAHRAPTRRDT